MPETTAPITSDEVIQTIVAAGLDYHDFKCEYAAKLTAHHPVWVAIAEMARTDAASVAAWKISGHPDPYATPEWLGAA
ncbi:hypothetical protein BTO20_05950 [Mycobacterium dioxanotrophicus]|uniref:Uncharacterized protein n=1 Tax=Mycobacterium dioxanotrophicus TaxID=482462 RepID=A0A1Y0BZ65_9MYCO|nr:hypothetical protein [Mycobacterium dioxanotrophicus]ART68188.1 hypothetical protein BTO20_05950 [Mycobacterium dioxanotrophicus]